MPNYFSLTRKTDPGAGPVPFADIDDELRAALGYEPHPQRYLASWYDLIGMQLASGQTWDAIRREYADRKARASDAEYAELVELLVKIVDWLEAHFDVHSGYMPRGGLS